MFGLLPFLALFLLWLICVPQIHSWRGALLTALVLWGVFIVATTEILSLFHALTSLPLVVIWGLLVLLLAGRVYQQRAIFPPIHFTLRGLSFDIGLMLALLLVLVGLVGLVGLIAPPNTWDSMAYHLPRVYFWEQFQSVAPYPTHTNRQLYQPPFAEFLMLHTQLLAGSDILANVGQWLALVGSMIGVSLIAKRLGAVPRGQLTAAVLAGTLPIGIMQATGSKNDFLVALWIICLAYFIVDTLHMTYRRALLMGAAAGLAILTKGTGYVYVAPLLLWGVLRVFSFQWSVFSGQRVSNSTPHQLSTQDTALSPQSSVLGSILIPFFMIGIVILALNIGHYTRNFYVFGTPLNAPAHNASYGNEIMTPSAFLSNVLRNVSLHLHIPSQAASDAVYQALLKIHEIIGLAPDDPRTTHPYNEFKMPPMWEIFNEDRAGNPIHLGLLGLGLLLFPLIPALRKNASLRSYLVVAVLQFALFCLLLKWQVWGTRLQLPFFVFSAGWVALVLTTILPRYLIFLLNLGLVIVGLFWVGNISTRPIFASADTGNPLAISFYIGTDNIEYPSIFTQSRLDMYLNAYSEMRPATQAAAQEIAALGCASIGLINDENALMYPLIRRLNAAIPELRVQDVNITNETTFLARQAPFSDFAPCAVVLLRGALPPYDEISSIQGRKYQRSWQNEAYEVFVLLGE